MYITIGVLSLSLHAQFKYLNILILTKIWVFTFEVIIKTDVIVLTVNKPNNMPISQTQ